MNIEGYEKIFDGGHNPVKRRVFVKAMLGAGLVAGGLTTVRPVLAEAAVNVDCNTVMFHTEGTGTIGAVINQNRREGRVPVTARELVKMLRGESPTMGRRFFCLTFDDGYLSQYQLVVPFLERMEIKGTFFVLDPVSWWGDGRHSYVGTEGVLDMEGRGMDIESHGISHQNLITIKRSPRYFADIMNSKSELEEVLQREIEIFCYPFGSYDKQVQDDVEAVGYKGAFSTISGNIQSSDWLYRLLRRRP